MTERYKIGGSFAPPLSAEKLEEYRGLAVTSDSPATAEAMLKLCKMVEVFQQTPPSMEPGIPHPVGEFRDARNGQLKTVTITPLAQAEKERIFDVVPWAHENEMYAKLFDGINAETHKPLRDAAFHLLWFAVELEKDREPITNDRI